MVDVRPDEQVVYLLEDVCALPHGLFEVVIHTDGVVEVLGDVRAEDRAEPGDSRSVDTVESSSMRVMRVMMF